MHNDAVMQLKYPFT